MDEALKWCAHNPVPAFVRILWACVLMMTTCGVCRLTKAAESKDMEGMKACYKLGQIYEEKAEHATVSLTPRLQQPTCND